MLLSPSHRQGTYLSDRLSHLIKVTQSEDSPHAPLTPRPFSSTGLGRMVNFLSKFTPGEMEAAAGLGAFVIFLSSVSYAQPPKKHLFLLGVF